MPQADPQLPDEHSKSSRKREMLELQELGQALLKLTTQQLESLHLPENLLLAIREAKSIASNEAKRRQLQYIGKLMRQIDAEPIKLALNKLKYSHDKATQQFHKTEEWRETLITRGDDSLNEFLSEYTNADRQQLRQLIRKAQQDRKQNKNTGGETALFRYLRTIINE